MDEVGSGILGSCMGHGGGLQACGGGLDDYMPPLSLELPPQAPPHLRRVTEKDSTGHCTSACLRGSCVQSSLRVQIFHTCHLGELGRQSDSSWAIWKECQVTQLGSKATDPAIPSGPSLCLLP